MVRLESVMRAFDVKDGYAWFYDKEGMEIRKVCFIDPSKDDLDLLRDYEEGDCDRYVQLEIDTSFEMDVMETFVAGLEPSDLRDELEAAMKKRDAPRSFRSIVFAASMEEEWHAIRGARVREEAIALCKVYGIHLE